ncbi:MAG: selenide, water dikinase SelD [Cyanobium sp.]
MQAYGSSGATAPPPRHQLLLAGGGHSHAMVLLRWLMRPQRRPAGTLITLVSRSSTALYSGTLPALVAGLLELKDCRIDLRALCARAGVSFVRAEILGLDPEARLLWLAERPPLRFERLSLDVGAVTAAGDGTAQAVKPLEPFLAWLSTLTPGAVVRIRGGGAAAVELALALRRRGMAPRLLLRGGGLRLGSAAANRLAERLLAEAAIPLERYALEEAAADLACTGSLAPPWLAAAGLPVDPVSGRVLTDASLEVVGHPGLFAAGDCGLIASDPRPASGVWAVRAAPLLAHNLQRSLADPPRPLRTWRPQRRALQLLGDGGWSAAGPRAVAFWGPLALGPSRWLWRWKRRLDGRFLEHFAAGGVPGPAAMACRGCAAKLAAAPLASALARLQRLEGGDQAAAEPLDAAPIATTAAGERLLQSVDGFPALIDDPWLNARLTTLHACGDLWASGAEVCSAQALVTLPEAAAPLQEELLFQTLAGVRSVLDPLGATLVGGHTLEARDGAGLALALSVNGRVAPERHWPKGPLQGGDALLLCGPLGSGVLFAAAMAGAAEPEWIDAALERMQRSQAPLVEILAAHGCRACTDVTGFGLLGHLGEMLGVRGAGRSGDQGSGDQGPGIVELDGRAIPAHAGALALLDQGWASSLAPANGAALALLDGPVRLLERGDGGSGQALRSLLIDPQTCGPLLAAVPAERAAAALAAVQRAGLSDAAQVGWVRENAGG